MFREAPNTMIITTKKVVRKETPILIVFHDEDDGMWQFLDGNDTDENEAAIISLEEILAIDSSIDTISDLPLGWVAWRENINSKWESQVQD